MERRASLMSSRSSTWRSTQERCGCNPSTSSFPSPTLQDFPASVTNHVREHNETFKATNKIQLTNMKEHMTVQNHQPQNALELVVPLQTIIHGMRSLVAELEGNPWSGGHTPPPPYLCISPPLCQPLVIIIRCFSWVNSQTNAQLEICIKPVSMYLQNLEITVFRIQA
jgi:hypothetical protein